MSSSEQNFYVFTTTTQCSVGYVVVAVIKGD